MKLGRCLGLILALGFAVPGAARAAVACPDLVRAIDADIKRLTPRLGAEPGPPGDSELAGVWDPIPFDFPGYETRMARLACWRVRKGGAVDRATTAAVYRASRFAQLKRDNEFRAGMGWRFHPIGGAFGLERATGVFGPVSTELTRKGLGPYRPDPEDRDYIDEFDGHRWQDSRDTYFLDVALQELAALCLASPGKFKSLVVTRRYDPVLLQPGSFARIAEEDADPVFVAYLNSERDRITADCPA